MIPIPGYEGHYVLDDNYDIWSIKRQKPYRMTTWVKRDTGHLRITLSLHGKKRSWGMHQIIMLVLKGPPPLGKEVCHNDGDPTNNHPSNLRYDTRLSNILDSVALGTHSMARKTHCPAGHEYTPDNTYYYRDGRSRQCRTCAINRSIESRRRKKEQREAVVSVTSQVISCPGAGEVGGYEG